ncbi:MAG: hypothetical protein ACRDKI_07225 [Solirubrobacterales bacterium]
MEQNKRKPGPASAAEKWIGGVGLLLSFGLAALVPVVAQSKDSEIDVLLGIAGFLAGFVITMDLTGRARMREIESRVIARLDEVEEARFGALPLQRLLSVPDIEDAIVDLVEAASEARAKRMSFLANRTIERINEDRDETIRISQGIFRCEDRREELRVVRSALEDSKRIVKAVAALGIDAWKTDDFDEYFDVYLDFTESLLQTRMFIVEPEDMDDPAMVDLLEKHAAAGVETLALNKNVLPKTLVKPIVIFDDALLLVHSDRHRDGAIEVHFTDEPQDVRDAVEDFDSLTRRARRNAKGLVLWNSALASQAQAEPA